MEIGKNHFRMNLKRKYPKLTRHKKKIDSQNLRYSEYFTNLSLWSGNKGRDNSNYVFTFNFVGLCG